MDIVVDPSEHYDMASAIVGAIVGAIVSAIVSAKWHPRIIREGHLWETS